MSDNIRRVVILNSDTGLPQEFHVSIKHLDHLIELVDECLDGTDAPESWGGDAVDSSAVYGFGVLFESIPPKFPMKDLLLWVQLQVGGSSHLAGSQPRAIVARLHRINIPRYIVEKALSKLAVLYLKG